MKRCQITVSVVFLIYVFSPMALAQTQKYAVNKNGNTYQIQFPKESLEARDLGLLINDRDPQSVQVGAYYQQVRGIPDENIVHLNFQPRMTMNNSDFQRALEKVRREMPPHVQALAIAWKFPYRVTLEQRSLDDQGNVKIKQRGISITSAFGFDGDFRYSGGNCALTQPSPYFNSEETAPYSKLKVRPAMLIAGVNFRYSQELIDRGIAADHSMPGGDGYFVRTRDNGRSVRYPDFISTVAYWNAEERLGMTYVDGKANPQNQFLQNVDDILFYLTGESQVPYLSTLRFVPGAIADHLTSSGGRLNGAGQMSILRWLEAGATASYGTVQEPCAYTSKFPVAATLVRHYFSGASVLEAYNRSVQMPGEGVFVGEPLAKPFGTRLVFDENRTYVQTTALKPGRTYLLQGKISSGKNFKTLKKISVGAPQIITVEFKSKYRFLRLIVPQTPSGCEREPCTDVTEN